jgi:signal transduction histidine kinase
VSHPGFVFNLSLTPGEVQIIYVRIESEGALSLPLTIWSQEALAQRDFTKQALNGFVYGVLIIMAGYNFGLFLFLRDRSYLYFVLFLLSLLGSYFWQDNFGHRNLWPNLVRFNAIAGQFFFVLGLIFVLRFTASFLQTRTHVPRLHKVINFLTVAFWVAIPLQFVDLGITARPVLVLTLASVSIIVAVGLIVWRQGFKSARYFLLAWLLLLASNLLFVLSLFDILPLTVFGEVGSQIGLVILILTLSLALADRINVFRQEREDAQAELIHNQQETLELKNEFNIALQASQEELEERVDERTAELTEAKEAAEATQAALEKANNELATVTSVSQDIVSTLELDTLLHLVLDQLRHVVDYHGAGVLTFDDGHLLFRAYHGITLDSGIGSLSIPVAGVSPLRQAMVDRQPFIIDDVWQDPTLSQEFQEATGLGLDELFAGAHSWIGIPLTVGDRVIGLLAYIHQEPGYYQVGDLQLAQAFANQVASALENAQLYEQAQATAATEERNRLARDLHDSAAQALYSALLFSATGQKLAARGDQAEAEYYQGRVNQVIQQALKDMRLLVFQLRPPVLEAEGLFGALRLRLEMVENRSGVEARLYADDIPPLPGDVAEELYRIAIEALNNALRHAQADNITVKLELVGEVVGLEVSDDGQGFDPATIIGQGGLGTTSIQERANELGADLTIDSALGQGTTVRVAVTIREDS